MLFLLFWAHAGLKGVTWDKVGPKRKKMGKLIIFITWDVTIFLILVISTNYFHPPYLDYNYVIKIPRAFYSIPSFLHASRRFPWWLIWASFSDQIELKTLPWAQKSKSGKKKKKKNLWEQFSDINLIKRWVGKYGCSNVAKLFEK